MMPNSQGAVILEDMKRYLHCICLVEFPSKLVGCLVVFPSNLVGCLVDFPSNLVGYYKCSKMLTNSENVVTFQNLSDYIPRQEQLKSE